MQPPQSLLTRKLFQTGSLCFPFPLNSNINNPTCVTNFQLVRLTFFAYLEAKPCVLSPGEVSRIASEEQCMKFSWLLSQEEIFLLGGKKENWDCWRDFFVFTIAPRNSLPSLWFYWSHSHSKYFCYNSLSLENLQQRIGFWYWLINIYFDPNWAIVTGHLPALKIYFHAKILVLQKDPFRDVKLWKESNSGNWRICSLVWVLPACIGYIWEVPDDFWLPQTCGMRRSGRLVIYWTTSLNCLPFSL